MTTDPVALPATSELTEAARRMKARGIGDAIVLEDSKVCGVVTDPDIVVRAVAEKRDRPRRSWRTSAAATSSVSPRPTRSSTPSS